MYMYIYVYKYYCSLQKVLGQASTLNSSAFLAEKVELKQVKHIQTLAHGHARARSRAVRIGLREVKKDNAQLTRFPVLSGQGI